PTTPWTTNAEGRGPAWSNSLFEDNAEFGLGMRLGIDAHRAAAEALVRRLAPVLGDELARALLDNPQEDEAGVARQRGLVDRLRQALPGVDGELAADAGHLAGIAGSLVRQGVWI